MRVLAVGGLSGRFERPTSSSFSSTLDGLVASKCPYGHGQQTRSSCEDYAFAGLVIVDGVCHKLGTKKMYHRVVNIWKGLKYTYRRVRAFWNFYTAISHRLRIVLTRLQAEVKIEKTLLFRPALVFFKISTSSEFRWCEFLLFSFGRSVILQTGVDRTNYIAMVSIWYVLERMNRQEHRLRHSLPIVISDAI